MTINYKLWLISIFLVLGAILFEAGTPFIMADGQNKLSNLPEKLAKVVALTPEGKEKGQIDYTAALGFGGLPGAPQINYPLVFLWAIWVGWILGTVGAFGGIMAGIGHITLFGIGAYASGFKLTNPDLNALLTDTIRASNQYLVVLGALIATYTFLRMKRIVLPLGLALGAGSVTGGLLIPWLTAGKVSLSSYIGYFGLAVLAVGMFLFWGTLKKKEDKQTAPEEKKQEVKQRVELLETSLFNVRLRFAGKEYRFNPLLPFFGGILIASLSSFLGIGGGFLYVPFMTGLLGLPMFVVAGTSSLAVLLSMISSIFSYVVLKQTFIAWGFILVEMSGVFIGAMVGPHTQKYIPEIWLKRIFVILACYVGIRYFSKGFFQQSWLPPF